MVLKILFLLPVANKLDTDSKSFGWSSSNRGGKISVSKVGYLIGEGGKELWSRNLVVARRCKFVQGVA